MNITPQTEYAILTEKEWLSRKRIMYVAPEFSGPRFVTKGGRHRGLKEPYKLEARIDTVVQK